MLCRVFNIVRYAIAIVAPVAVFTGHIWISVLLLMLVLLVNNYFDDLVFYFGYTKPKKPITNGGILSPVNGVVTYIEHGVPKYNHLIKEDVLTKEEIIGKCPVVSNDGKLYNHVTIFLNKFNHHVVGNICSPIISVSQYDMNGTKFSMVEDGYLISNNKGDYLTNTFVEITYENGAIAVLTMDKYISKAVPIRNNGIDYFICRGSQCDIYIPISYSLDVDFGDIIQVYDEIADDIQSDSLEESPSMVFGSIIKDIKRACSVGVVSLIFPNVKKTLCTLKQINATVFLLMLLLNPYAAALFVFVSVFRFYIDRAVKNFLYAMMNCIGYRKWMTELYRITHKLLSYE